MKRILILCVLLLMIAGQLHAQHSVSGYIADSNGEPMIGVTVSIKGSTIGTTSNFEGYYTISAPGESSILVFSFIGMKTMEFPVGDKIEINVTMEEDVQSLEQVVVIGYGTVKRENLTGAVADIRADELEELPVANLAEALEGRLAGVKIGKSTGIPGASTTLKIRTESSFGRIQEDVLFVIDGIVYDSDADGAGLFNSLDASEVESISVLKDAAAAVYGARAAAGVVVVRTKRGRVGKPKINYSGSYGVAQATKFPEMMSSYDLASMYNNILGIYETYEGRISPYAYYAEDELSYFDSIGSYNWIGDLLKPAIVEKHTLNVQGGTDRVKYFAGGSFYDESGMIENLNFRKYSIRSNVEGQITKNLKTNVGLNYQYDTGMKPNFSGETQTGVLRDTYKHALTALPWIPLSIDGLPVGNQSLIDMNPLALLESGSYKKNYGGRTNLNASLEYSVPFLDGLNLRAQYSYYESNGHGKEYAQDYTAYEFPLSGSHNHLILPGLVAEDATPVLIGNDEEIYESRSYGTGYQFNLSAHYSKKIDKHDFSGLLVYELAERSDNDLRTYIYTQSAYENIDYLWAFSKDNNYTSATSYHETANIGYIGRLNYMYDEKYILESTFRYEGSQRFHPDYRWGFFPAVSMAWIMSKENFMKENLGFIDFAKIRGSVGKVGNDRVPAFTWKTSFVEGDPGPIFGTDLVNAIEARNNLVYIPSIRWQETNSYNIGMDMQFLDKDLDLTLDYYYRKTMNIFNRRENVPISTGVIGDGSQRVPEENYGEMYAKGLEISLGYKGIIAGELNYRVSGNFSWDKHRKLKVIQNEAILGQWDDQLLNDPSNQPGYTALGIMRTQEQLDAWMALYPDYTISGDPLQLGMIYYEDIRGESYIDSATHKRMYLPPDGKITGDDMSIIAEYTSPPYHYNFAIQLAWKGLSISTNFGGAFGHKVFISKDEQYTPDPAEGYLSNVFSFWSDYWTPDNQYSAFPRPYRYGLGQQNTTFWMRNGHTLRMNDLQLGYTLPQKVYSRLNIQQFRIYFSAKNLVVLVNPFDHKDPGISRGYDYPLMRTYNLGVKISL